MAGRKVNILLAAPKCLSSVEVTTDTKISGLAFESNVKGRLYPVIGCWDALAVVANFGDDLEKRPFVWGPGNEGRYDTETVKAEGNNEGKQSESAKVDS